MIMITKIMTIYSKNTDMITVAATMATTIRPRILHCGSQSAPVQTSKCAAGDGITSASIKVYFIIEAHYVY